jgi:hypothetical protein
MGTLILSEHPGDINGMPEKFPYISGNFTGLFQQCIHIFTKQRVRVSGA